jgi:hypothetical protein
MKMNAKNVAYKCGILCALLAIALFDTKVASYWRPYSGLNRGTILRTCVSGDPRFNFLNPLGKDDELVAVALPIVDLALACTLRALAGERLLRPDAANLTALEHLMISHPSCVELPSAAAGACHVAHFATIDWLVRAGFDLNGEKHGGGAYLMSAVISKDKEMFAFC